MPLEFPLVPYEFHSYGRTPDYPEVLLDYIRFQRAYARVLEIWVFKGVPAPATPFKGSAYAQAKADEHAFRQRQ